VNDNFFELGGDSILSIQIVAKANQAGLGLTPREIFQQPTVAGQAAVARRGRKVEAEQGLVEGPVPLTPIQRWFLELELPEREHWNHGLLFEVRQELELEPLKEAVGAVLGHHDALRLRLRRNAAGEWEQENAGLDGEVPVERVELSGLGEAEQVAALEARAAELQRSLDLEAGPLVRVALFDLGEGQPGRLLIVIHHWVVDGVSWRILLEDLLTAYRQAAAGLPVKLPAKTTSFRRWAERLSEWAQGEEVRGELEYWRSLAWEGVRGLPLDYPEGRNDEASGRTLTVGLEEEETRALLQEVPAAYRSEINEVLLTALALALKEWTGGSVALVDLEGHGREDLFDDIDLSRTVGWFTSIFPVVLEPGEALDSNALRRVKEQLREIPRRGLGYSALRYLTTDLAVHEALRALPKPDISFNYLGQMDRLPNPAMFGSAAESIGAQRSPQGQRSHLLAVNGSIVGRRLELEWSYSASVFRRETVEQVAHAFITSLRSIIQQSQSADASALAPSDFPLANLSQDKLDKVIAKLNR
jgi:non-ribosomal peptide synthase protein (TIGR01720 family)